MISLNIDILFFSILKNACIVVLEIIELNIILWGLFNAKYRNKKMPYIKAALLYIILCTLIHLLSESYVFLLNTIFVVCYFIYFTKPREKLILIIFLYISCYIIEEFWVIIVSLFGENDISYIWDSILLRMLVHLLAICTMFILMKISKFYNIDKCICQLNKSGFIFIFGAVSISVMLLIKLELYLDYPLLIRQNMVMFHIFLIVLLTLLLIAICILFIHTKKYYEEQERLKNEILTYQVEYYNNLTKNDLKLKKFRHDIKGHIYCIKSYLKNSDYKQAKEYLDTVFEDIKVSINKRFNTGNDILDMIIEAVIEDEDFNVQVLGKFPKDIDINSADLCTLFYNIIKNAKEACDQVLDSEVKIILIQPQVVNEDLYIKISNSTIMKEPSLHTIKSDKYNHGYGMLNIQNIVKKYGGEKKHDLDNGIFSLEIIFRGVCKAV